MRRIVKMSVFRYRYPCRPYLGIYFHTRNQEADWPTCGIECQVDDSHGDWRRSGSLYGVKNLSRGPETPPAKNKEMVTILPKPPVTDNVWYTQEVIYQAGLVTVKLGHRRRRMVWHSVGLRAYVTERSASQQKKRIAQDHGHSVGPYAERSP